MQSCQKYQQSWDFVDKCREGQEADEEESQNIEYFFSCQPEPIKGWS